MLIQKPILPATPCVTETDVLQQLCRLVENTSNKQSYTTYRVPSDVMLGRSDYIASHVSA